MSRLIDCIDLYHEAFGFDEAEFEDELFGCCFKYCKTIEVNGKVVSMLFAFPCEIVFENKTLNAKYIFAVATKIEERGKGYMSKLLNRVKQETNSLLFLRPANEGLIKLYGSLGFKSIPAKSIECEFPFIKPLEEFASLAEKYKTPDSSSFTAMYYSTKENIEKINFIYSME